MRFITFLIYIVFYESLCLGGCAYIVFFKDQSPWWFVLAGYFSACAYSPKKWGEMIKE